jgi:hypothetical protein
MQNEILLNILDQNQMTNSFAFGNLNDETADFRLNEQTSSAGFIYRHIGETISLFGTFFGIPTETQHTTMGQTDNGQGNNVEESRKLIENGYLMLRNLIENTPDADWLETIETPFFGKVTKIRLFVHILYHSSSHAGQISLILAKGRKDF